MSYEAINFKQKYSLFNDRWSPKIVAKLNDYHFNARPKGSIRGDIYSCLLFVGFIYDQNLQ